MARSPTPSRCCRQSPNPFIGPQVTFVSTTNALLINQIAGGNTPLLGTNTVGAGAGYITNAAITVGMTNQWHFYVVTNTARFHECGVHHLFVADAGDSAHGRLCGRTPRIRRNRRRTLICMWPGQRDPLASSLTNLNPVVISNCVHGLNGDGASLANGTGTEFVAYTNSHAG